MTENPLLLERSFTSSLVSALSLMREAPTRAMVEQKAKELAAIFSYQGDLAFPVLEAMSAVDMRMGLGVSLVEDDALHDERWVEKRDDINWIYAPAYEKFLRSEGWSASMVQSLSDVGSKILAQLQDPKSDGDWNRRGLVIGHVQSGKTANYLGLVAKAADAGYKFIVIIAGIHNNLRTQTQERVDEGFVGRSSDPDEGFRIGVGLTEQYPHPATLTNRWDDFNSETAARSGWQLNDFSKPIVLVIKKNVSTLQSLHKWLKKMNAQGKGQITDVPMLMIDDEADNASINTNKEDCDPTRTNSLIREVLSLFAKKSYVGYTATPFANIFINPDSYDETVREDLFPKDFIYSLDAPNAYFGPETVFVRDETSKDVVRTILDAENIISLVHKSSHTVEALPPSLIKAFHTFVVAAAIRAARGQGRKHSSMMVNVSRFVAVQNQVRSLLSLEIQKCKLAIKANYALPASKALSDPTIAAIRSVYESEFSNCGISWASVQKELNGVFETFALVAVNSRSDEALDYKKYEKSGESVNVVAVGGLSLSRGLTIEGLVVSYVYRNTKMYDTLMQMGRWFGYRTGYRDLCRVYLSDDSISWYGHIAEASEELRQQIRRMRLQGMSPRQFGLYVEAHPDSLMITALNKMRSGKRLVIKHNFSGKLFETHRLPNAPSAHESNLDLIREFWKRSFNSHNGMERTSKGWFVSDAPNEQLAEFIAKFQVHESLADKKDAVLAYLSEISREYSECDVLLLSISANQEHGKSFQLGYQERDSAKLTDGYWQFSKDRVASRGDESLGLDSAQIDEAKREAAKDNKKPSDYHYRVVRKKPLLMVHLIKFAGSDQLAPAFGISFPDGDFDRTVEVVANRVWMQQWLGEVEDSEADDD